MEQQMFAIPYTCVVHNCFGNLLNTRTQFTSFHELHDNLIRAGFPVTDITKCYNYNDAFLIEFGSSQEDCWFAFKLQAMFDNQQHGLEDWRNCQFRENNPGPYLWVASPDDASYPPLYQRYVIVDESDIYIGTHYDKPSDVDGYSIVDASIKVMYEQEDETDEEES